MIKIILIRHGSTVANEQGVLSGIIDSKLSKKGILQANKITEYLKDEKIDKIYSTSFSRTKETIKGISLLKNIQIEEREKLNEINFGDFEGMSFEKIKREYKVEFDKMIKQGFKYKYPNGESLEDTFRRVKKDIDEILQINKDKNIIICSHGGTIRNIISYLLCGDYKYHWNFRIDNASVTEVEIDNGFAVINKLNDTSFL